MEFQELLNAPGMRWVLSGAPYFGGVLWLWIFVLLLKDGFNDLVERLTRPRWRGPDRANALVMIPLRALMLAGVAALGSGLTTAGLVFNLGALLNIIQLIRQGFSG